MKKTSRLAAVLISAAMLLSACGGQTAPPVTPSQAAPSQSAAAPKSNDLIIGTYMPVTTLVPWKTTSDGDGYIIRQIYHTLVEMDNDSNFTPSFAKSWECADDNVTWTFHLRDDIYWQTGNGLFKDEKVRVTAEDVKYSFEYYLKPENGSVRYTDLSSTLKSITVIDPNTIQFVTNDIDVLFEYRMYQNYIIPRRAIEQNWDFGAFPVGSGAYKFVEHVTDTHVILEKNKDFWKEPALDRVIYKIIPDKSVSAIALQNKEIDVALAILPTEVGNISSKDYLELKSSGVGSYRWIGFNCAFPLFTDPEIRRALSMAVDMDGAVNAIFKNDAGVELAVRAYGPISYERPGGNKEAFKEVCVSFDPKKAEEILDAKGWKKGADGIREKDGKKFKFTLQVGNNDANREKLAVIVSSQLKAIGIDCTAQTVEWATHTDDIKNGKVEMYILGGYSNLDGPLRLMRTDTTTFSPNCNYSNPKVDAILKEAWKTIDATKRSEMLTEAAKLFIADAPHIFPYFEYGQTGVNKWVKDFDYPSVYHTLCNSNRNVAVTK